MNDLLVSGKSNDINERQEHLEYSNSEDNYPSLRKWLDIIEREDNINFLFELEMWIKCFNCFFRLNKHPLSDQEKKDIISYNFTEELRVISGACLRMSYLCSEILNTHQKGNISDLPELNLSSLTRSSYIIEKLLEQPTPRDSIISLSQSLTDIRVLIDQLLEVPLSNLQIFISIGNIINREIKGCRYIDLLDIYRLKFQQNYIENSHLLSLIKNISHDSIRHDISKMFSEIFYLLHCLDFVQDDLNQDRPLKSSLLIFVFLHSEMNLLVEFLETRIMKIPELPTLVSESIDATIYALQMELKKVFGRELIGFAQLKQASTIYGKVENTHGLLRDCLQQSMVALAQVFDPACDGILLFNNFQTRLEQSLHLRSGIWRLLCLLRKFERTPDKGYVTALIEDVSTFRDTTLKYLMYKDWDDYERFLEEITTARNMEELIKVVHIFGTFLETLLGQTNMRAVLANHPFNYPESN